MRLKPVNWQDFFGTAQAVPFRRWSTPKSALRYVERLFPASLQGKEGRRPPRSGEPQTQQHTGARRCCERAYRWLPELPTGLFGIPGFPWRREYHVESESPSSSFPEPGVVYVLGKLTPEEWGILIYKHLDHHLRHFGV